MTRSFHRRLDQLPCVFELADAFFGRHLLDSASLTSVHLVLEELFTNSVKHQSGSESPIRIVLELHDRELKISVIDRDVDDFDITRWPAPDVKAGLFERKPGGLGIHLVRQLTDGIDYRYDNRESVVTVTKRLEN